MAQSPSYTRVGIAVVAPYMADAIVTLCNNDCRDTKTIKGDEMHRRTRLINRGREIGLWGVLVCGSVFSGAAVQAEQAVTSTLLYHAHVFTAEYAQPYAEAVAIRGERIIAVGRLADVERAAGPSARKVDLHRQFLMPGMIDGHAHPIA